MQLVRAPPPMPMRGCPRIPDQHSSRRNRMSTTSGWCAPEKESFKSLFESLHIVTAPDDGSNRHTKSLSQQEGHADKGETYGHTYHATTRPRRPLHTPFRRGIGHRDRCALSPPLHPWLCRATSAAASSSQLQRERRAAGILRAKGQRDGWKIGQRWSV